MSKIQTLSIENFKAIDKFNADFKGCSAIITAGNNKGKTSFLRGLIDRIRFVRPDIIVKKGKKEGHGEMILDTGEKFIWEFDTDGHDKLTYVSDKGAKKIVSVELGRRFFPQTFDIDKFLQSTPKEQSKQLQKIVGIDFTEIDTRYQKAYDERTANNFESEKFHVKLSSMLQVPKIESVDLTQLQAKKESERKRLNDVYTKNKEANTLLRNKYAKQCDDIRTSIQVNNDVQAANTTNFNSASEALSSLKTLGYEGKEVDAFVGKLKKNIQEQKVYAAPPEPAYVNEMPDDSALQEIDKKILKASEINTKAKAYQEYVSYKQQTEAAKSEAEEANKIVIEIESERKKLISSAKFPKGIAITPQGITVDDLPLNREQISTSKLYTSALRIASMNLGKVKTLYFDASFLDKNSLAEIESWANENDLQLLIERPDFDGGEIKYELIEKNK